MSENEIIRTKVVKLRDDAAAERSLQRTLLDSDKQKRVLLRENVLALRALGAKFTGWALRNDIPFDFRELRGGSTVTRIEEPRTVLGRLMGRGRRVTVHPSEMTNARWILAHQEVTYWEMSSNLKDGGGLQPWSATELLLVDREGRLGSGRSRDLLPPYLITTSNYENPSNEDLGIFTPDMVYHRIAELMVRHAGLEWEAVATPPGAPA